MKCSNEIIQFNNTEATCTPHTKTVHAFWHSLFLHNGWRKQIKKKKLQTWRQAMAMLRHRFFFNILNATQV